MENVPSPQALINLEAYRRPANPVAPKLGEQACHFVELVTKPRQIVDSVINAYDDEMIKSALVEQRDASISYGVTDTELCDEILEMAALLEAREPEYGPLHLIKN